jgi:hypothetical protein
MKYHFVGQVKSAKSTSRKDKATGQTSVMAEINILYTDHDKNDQVVMDLQTIQVDIALLDKFKSNLEKYCIVTYTYISSSKGTFIFPDDDMNVRFYEKNPLVTKG